MHQEKAVGPPDLQGRARQRLEGPVKPSTEHDKVIYVQARGQVYMFAHAVVRKAHRNVFYAQDSDRKPRDKSFVNRRILQIKHRELYLILGRVKTMRKASMLYVVGFTLTKHYRYRSLLS